MQRARELSGQPVKRGTMAHDHDVYMVLADAAAQSRDAKGLREYAPRLEELAGRDNHQLYLAVAKRALGVMDRLAGDYAKSAARLNAAAQLFEQIGTRWQLGRTHRELAELALAQSNGAAARDYLERAMAEFEAMKALPDLERTRVLARE